MKKLIPVFTAALVFITSCGVSVNESGTAFDPSCKTGSMALDYAEQFSVDYYNDYSLITIDKDKFLLVPESKPVPENTDGLTVIKQPVDNIYDAASSTLDLFDAADALDKIKMTSTDKNDWSLAKIKSAVESGTISYIGKYRSPDYETLVSKNCSLALESTMIYHSPDVKEKIEELGIPVMVERSSYESHPLGRMEWIKLYGLLTGNEDTANNFFDEKEKLFDSVVSSVKEGEKKTAAFFYVSSNGYVNIRKPGDYISKMIELAGGKYIFTAADLNVDDNELSTMNIQMESFYEKAKDADILIYNSTIEGELDKLSDLTDISSLFSDFKAVKEGNVWCTGQNMFQQTTGSADMISDLSKVINGGENTELTFLRRLK